MIATFCVMEKRHIEAFLDHLNSVRPTIQFTMELEDDGTLPFLDTLLTRREDGSINIGVYRKKTHIDPSPVPAIHLTPTSTCKEGSGLLPLQIHARYQDYVHHHLHSLTTG